MSYAPARVNHTWRSGPHHWGPDGETGQTGAAPPTGCRRTAKQVAAAGATPCLALPLPALTQPANHTVAYRHLPHRRSLRQIFLCVTSGLGKQRGRTILSSRMDRGSRTAINWLFYALACRPTCGQPLDKLFRPGINWQTSWTKSLATFGDSATSPCIG